MPIAHQLRLDGQITGAPARLELAGAVLGNPALALAGQISRRLVERFDGKADGVVTYGLRVRLGRPGADPTDPDQPLDDVTRDLVGDVELEQSIDDPIPSAAITLAGKRWAPTATVRTWTMCRLEIDFATGPPGAVEWERRFVGIVETLEPASRAVYRIRAAGLARLYADFAVCYELAPGAGLSRGEIARQIAALAGITTVDVPAGGRVTKPVLFDGEPLFEALAELGEPEGWTWSIDLDGRLVATTAAARPTPDHTWHLRELLAPPKVDPPENIAPDWIIRTEISRQVAAGENDIAGGGLETVVERTVTEGDFAPARATHEQLTDGSIVERAVLDVPLIRRVISEVIERTTLEGGRIVRREHEEKGWKNPAAATLTTGAGSTALQTPGEGPGPQGLYFLPAYLLSESGPAVAWTQERYVTLARTIETPAYEGDGTEAAVCVESFGWVRREASIRSGDGNWIINILSDGSQSYQASHYGRNGIEGFDRLATNDVARRFGGTGAQASERIDTKSWHGRRARPGVDRFETFSGDVITTPFAIWERTEATETGHQLDASGRVANEFERRFAWELRPNRPTAEFVEQVPGSSRVHRPLSRQSHEEITAEGPRLATRLRSGAPPLPRYRSSPLRQYTSEPLDVVWSDPVLRRWFGPGHQVLQPAGIESAAEAEAFLRRQRARELAHQITVERPEALARAGETVRVVDPSQHLDQAGLLVAVRLRRGPSRSVATYVIESPLEVAE